MHIILGDNRIIASDELGRILPHQGVMSLLKMVMVVKGAYTGYFQPLPEAWYFQGHFPGDPVTPLTILEEAAAQFGLAFVADTTYPGHSVRVLAKEIAGQMRTDKPVRPGDIVTITLQGEPKMRTKGNGTFVKGDTSLMVGGKIICLASVSGLVIPQPWW